MPGQLPPLGGDLRFIRKWKLDEFLAAMRTGIDPGGRSLDEQMRWRVIRRMSDDDLRALYEISWICPKPEIKARMSRWNPRQHSLTRPPICRSIQ